MSTINVSVATEKQVTLAQGVAIKVTLATAGGVEVTSVNVAAPYSATFPDVQDGDYQVTAVAIDVNGLATGIPVTSSVFTVVGAIAVITSDVPSSITVSVVP